MSLIMWLGRKLGCAKRHNQEEGVNHDETFVPVAGLEAIRMLIAFASFMRIKLYQMDVECAFFNAYCMKKFMLDDAMVLKI